VFGGNGDYAANIRALRESATKAAAA